MLVMYIHAYGCDWNQIYPFVVGAEILEISDGWFTFFSTLLVSHHFIHFSFIFPTATSNTELGVSIKIQVGEGEPVESAIRRFKREVNKSGHLMELRHRRYFENKQEKMKRKVKEARMRKRLERMQRKRMANRT